MYGRAKITIVGTVVKKEMRQTGSGKDHLRLSLVVNTKGYNGKEDESSFFDVSFFEGGAQVLNKYTDKGSPLYVEGEMKQTTWTNNEGQKQTRYQINGRDFCLLPKGNVRSNLSQQTFSDNATRQQHQSLIQDFEDANGQQIRRQDDIPF